MKSKTEPLRDAFPAKKKSFPGRFFPKKDQIISYDMPCSWANASSHEPANPAARAGTLLPSLLFRSVLLDNRRNLGHHIINIFKHRALCRSQRICPIDMVDHLLITIP